MVMTRLAVLRAAALVVVVGLGLGLIGVRPSSFHHYSSNHDPVALALSDPDLTNYSLHLAAAMPPPMPLPAMPAAPMSSSRGDGGGGSWTATVQQSAPSAARSALRIAGLLRMARCARCVAERHFEGKDAFCLRHPGEFRLSQYC